VVGGDTPSAGFTLGHVITRLLASLASKTTVHDTVTVVLAHVGLPQLLAVMAKRWATSASGVPGGTIQKLWLCGDGSASTRCENVSVTGASLLGAGTGLGVMLAAAMDKAAASEPQAARPVNADAHHATRARRPARCAWQGLAPKASP
jgi:hypothetical protein